MGRGPRDFESRASTSFTTPAPGVCRRADAPLLPHLHESVEIVIGEDRSWQAGGQAILGQ